MISEKLSSRFPNFRKIKGDDGTECTYPHDCSIFTTNYDDVVETNWRGAARINDLWTSKSGTLVLDVDKYEGDMLNLIKLHDSLDWFGLDDGRIIKLVNTTVSTYAKRKVTGEFMLYPIQQKDLYLYPWFNLFYRFKRDLETAKTWIIIGYSFNDEFILNIFREALDRGVHNLVIVTPDANRIIEDKFSKHKNYVKAVLGKFGEEKTILDILHALDNK